MNQNRHVTRMLTLLALSGGLLLTGCGGSDGSSQGDGGSGPDSGGTTTASGFDVPDNAMRVAPDAADGSDITDEMANTLFEASRMEDAMVLLPEGDFTVSGTITVNGADGLTITGHGRDETVLDFSGSSQNDAISFTSGSDISIRDLKIMEAPKNGVKASGVNGIKMAHTATVWEGKLESDNGAYGLYPVNSQNVLVEHNYVKGSADAGVYVGQSENIVVRNNTTEGNVAGIEIENSEMADVYNNTATGNAGGLLVFDLPGLTKAYGSNVRLFSNESTNNNAENVGGGVVGSVPSGTGAIILATSDVEIYNNELTGNDTTAVAVTSYLLQEPGLAQSADGFKKTLADGWTPMVKNIYIHQNKIGTNTTKARGDLLASIADGYEIVKGEVFPAILYDGLGELLSNAGMLDYGSELKDDVKDDVSYGPYAKGDKVCVNNNSIAAESAGVNTGLVYTTDPMNIKDQNSDGVPEPNLLSEKTNANAYLNCTQPRLKAAEVTFRGETYGCKGDDLEEDACKL